MTDRAGDIYTSWNERESHDPRRIEPPVEAIKKSSSSEPKYGAVSEKVGSRSGDSEFPGLLEVRFGADGPHRKRIVLG